ncbi:MAG: hypothetical protein WCJ36_02450 [Candidatus Saccharibacteria bacterium]
MKIGIIGPNNIFNGDIGDRKGLPDRVAEILASSNHEIVLTPDKNSLLEYFGNKYKEFNGNKIWLVLPTEEQGYDSYLNTDLGEIISCKDWDRQANEFNRQCDIFICVGYAWGGMKEIACAQYFNKKKIYILKEFISDKLPEELGFLVEYISINDLATTI